MSVLPIKLFFDGGCQPNPGKIEGAVVRKGVVHYRHDLGTGDNSDAEWLAAIHALEIARSLGLSDIVLLGDSADVVGKANDVVRCSGDEARHLERFRALAASARSVRVRHVKRSQNLAGIALARRHAR